MRRGCGRGRGAVTAALIAAALAGGCGDSVERDVVLTATSGQRLALSWYRFPDGTEQPEPGRLYDRALHTACAPARWTDGVVRCVPLADDAVFVDDACATAIGVATTTDEPTHFLGRDVIAGDARAVRVYVAGADVDPIATYFRRIEGTCVGPFAADPDATFVAITGELTAADLAPVDEAEAGDGRLALVARTAGDGLWAPLGLRDRARDAACVPALGGDGLVRCAPADATPAAYFTDASCVEPAVAVDAAAPAPRVAQLADAAGCPTYHAVGAPVAAALYRRDGDACRPAPVTPAVAAFAVGAPLELPTLTRTVEALPDRRLQRIVLAGDGLRFYDDRLVDTALGGDCVRRVFDDEITRCVPAALAPTLRLFTATCIVAVAIAELPARACERPAFAAGTSATGFAVRAIGDPVTEPLFHWVADRCQPYVASPGTALYRLGPPIDATAFPGALLYGER